MSAGIVAEAVLGALLARREAAFAPGNDKVWGEGNWIACDRCPDAVGFPSFHHREFHPGD